MIADVRCQEFVGRRKELAVLQEHCKEAFLGRGSLVFISGEPGIGKTRLIGELARRTRAPSMLGATGYCLEHARAPLGPLSDIVRTLYARDESVLAGARGVRQVLARLVPEIEPDAAPSGDGGARSQYAAIAELFRRCGERQPLMLVIEDADWADLSTIEFIKFIAAGIGRMHLVLLVLLRAQADNVQHFAPVLSQLRRQLHIRALELQPLAPAEMETFVSLASGSQQPRHEDLRRIRQLADGNPLFAEELLASALDSNNPEPNLPASIREIFLERIGNLDGDDRDILVEAAVIGRRFDPAFLAQLTKRPIERILLALRRARALQLIVEDVDHVHAAVFRHALVRETLYGSILTAEARRLHRRIATELESMPDRERHLAALAYHSWAARDISAALVYNELAGDEAMQKLAANEAALFYERSLSCATAGDALEAHLQRKLADAYSGGGLTGKAIELFGRAYEHFARCKDVRSAVETCMSLGREHAAHAQGDAALRWRLAGLAAIQTMPDDALAFEATASVAFAYACLGDRERASEYVERAARFTGERRAAAEQNLHDARAIADLLSGATSRALERCERVALEAVAHGSPRLAVRAFGNLYTFASATGYIETATRAAERAVALAGDAVESMYRPYALLIGGKASAFTGALDLARRRLSEAQDAAAGLDSPRIYSQFVILGLFLGLHLDEPGLLRQYSDARAIDDAFSSREPWWIAGVGSAFAEVYARTGRAREAELLVHRALTGVPHLLMSPELAITAAAYGPQEDLPGARDMLQNWSEHAASDAARAFLDLFDAYRAAREDRAPESWAKSAARRFEALGLPFYTALAHEICGERAAAVQIYLRIGSVADIARLNSPRATLDIADARFTKREREVFLLVADGRSNREIANVMHISERTVESHIRSILGKVDGHSRIDLIELARARKLSVLR